MNDIDILNQICPNIQFDLSKHYEMDEPEEVEFVEALQKAMPIPASWERIVNPMKLTGIRRHIEPEDVGWFDETIFKLGKDACGMPEYKYKGKNKALVQITFIPKEFEGCGWWIDAVFDETDKLIAWNLKND